MDAYELQTLVDDYMARRGWKLKKSSFNLSNMTYTVTTMDYDELDAKLTKCKNGSTKITFKLNGKVTSIYK